MADLSDPVSLLQASDDSVADLLTRLGTQADGLNARRASQVRRRVGLNLIGHEGPEPAWRHLWRCYRDPFNLLLTGLALISLVTAQAGSAGVIAAMVALSTGLRFFQERRASRAAAALRAFVAHQVRVRRPDGPQVHRIASARLVPGDIVLLSAGDMVPADCRVIESKDLFVSQATLTGESLPIEKHASPFAASARATGPSEPGSASDAADPLLRLNLLWMGSTVVSGTAVAVVVATGERTRFGGLARHAASAVVQPTAFQAQLRQVGRLLLRVVLVMVPLVFALNAYTKADWLQAALFALSVGVGLTPEMLPMVVTSTLARGALALSRAKVIVKRLDAIHDLGAMDVLCTDKTGTLTQDHLVLALQIDAFGLSSTRVLQLAWLNSRHQTGLSNPMDAAVLHHAVSLPQAQTLAQSRKVDEVPFDFERRRMSVLLASAAGPDQLITKGAVDELLSVCNRVRQGEIVLPFDEGLRARVSAILAPLEDQGLRVIGVASREWPADRATCSVADEVDLILEGFIAFEDPPKPSSSPALKALNDHGIAIKVLTGDHPRVAAQVCARVGLTADQICTGRQIEAMTPAQLRHAVAGIQVFAQLSPLHKERIVQALRSNGHVVGFLGDGINDAPALHAADVGISVHSAVDIARESADIVLLEKSLLVVVRGVIEGRRTVVNMHKYIRMAASSNFGNALSILVASAVLPFLPMLPVHLLLQNLIYDVTQGAVPFDKVDPDELIQPRHWRADDLLRFMLWFGPLSSAFDLLTFAALWFIFEANDLASQSLFQSGWFVIGLLSQTLVVHSLRTAKVPVLQSRAAPVMVMGSLLVLGLAIWLPMGPLAASLHFQPLPAEFWMFAAGMLVAYLAAVQWVKTAFIRRHGWH